MSKEEILRQMVYVDPKKFSHECYHLDNNVIYAVASSDKPPSEMTVKDFKEKLTNYICFSGYSYAVAGFIGTSKTKKPNRLYYKLAVHPTAKELLNAAERVRWIQLAKMHGLLPAYISDGVIKESDCIKTDSCGEFVLDISDMCTALLYVYLSTLRHMREDPGFPKLVIHLVDDLGMNFYAAHVFASKITMTSTGHHIYDVYRSYGQDYTRQKKSIAEYISTEEAAPFYLMNGLRRFINDPDKYDGRKANDKQRLGSSNVISGIISSARIPIGAKDLNMQDLLDEDVVNAIMSLTDEEAIKNLTKFLEKKKHIKFMEAK